MSSKHIQQGYAIAKTTYTLTYDKTSEERHTPPHQEHQLPAHDIKTERIREVLRITWWAKCKKNELGDEKLSLWYSKVVRAQAESVIARFIREGNENNARRVRAWKDNRDNPKKGYITKNAPRPPEYTFAEYDARKLTMEKLHASADKPDWSDGKDVAQDSAVKREIRSTREVRWIQEGDKRASRYGTR